MRSARHCRSCRDPAACNERRSTVNAPSARPIAFGAASELFGWLHPGASPSPLALVLCSAIGNEEVFSHRALRQLAQASARAGIPALRFDYHGTGDSAGGELEPGRVAAWLASIHQAVEAARRHTGASRVCLLGVRLGSTLAAKAAESRDDVAAFVAIAPVAQGRAHVRELKLAHLSRQDVADAPTVPVDGLLDSSNFVLMPEALADIAQLDLRAIARPPAARMLVVERDDLPASSQWSDHCLALGAQLTRCTLPGYAELMGGQAVSQGLPTRIIDQVVQWLPGCVDSLPPARAAAVPAGEGLAAAPGVVEQPVQVPAGTTTLFGILSAAADASARPRSAVLLLPAGVGRHIGQGRLYVDLARELAAGGHLVLRLDLSGLGESAPHVGLGENSVYEPCAVDDVAAALRFLGERAGGADLHVLGHCSGAYNAMRHVAQGGRVAQIIQLNPQIYSAIDRLVLAGTQDEPVSARAAGAPSPVRRWGRHWRRTVWRLGRRVGWPFRAELRALARRGTVLHYVFGTLGSTEAELHRQAGRTLVTLIARGEVTLTRLPGSDHIFSRWHDRHALRLLVRGLIEKPAPARAAVAAPGTLALDRRPAAP